MSVILKLAQRLLPDSIPVLLLTLVLAYIVFKYVAAHLKLSHIPKIEGWIPFFGNILQILPLPFEEKTIDQKFEEMMSKEMQNPANVDRGLSTVWLFGKPLVVVYKPELLEKVLLNSEQLQKGEMYRFLKPWLFNGLLLSTGPKWRNRRRILTPAFHFSILSDFIPISFEVASTLIKNLLEEQENNGKIKHLMKPVERSTLSTICRTSLGISLEQIEAGSSKRNALNYAHSLEIVSHALYVRTMNPILEPDFMFDNSQIGKDANKQMELLTEFMDQVIDERVQQRTELRKQISSKPAENGNSDSIYFGKSKQRSAFLDLIVDAYLSQQEQEKPPSEDERLDLLGIREEVNTFTFAGFDTSSTALFCTLYLLGLNPDCQEKCYQELLEVFGANYNEAPTADQLAKLKYVEACIKESLRVLPPVPLIARTLEKALTLEDNKQGNSFYLPKDTTLSILINAIHSHPKYFGENPREFKPDRFFSGSEQSIQFLSYVPFSAGNRNCIGQRFAMNNLKTVLSKLLHDLRFESLLPYDQLRMCTEVVQKPAVDCPTMVYRRSH